MPNTADIEYKTEQSILNWLQASGTHGVTIGIAATNFYHGQSTDTVTLPGIFVSAEVDQEAILNSGIYRLDVEITLRVQPDDTATATFEGYWEKIRAILAWDELKQRLSDLSGYHCYLALRTQRRNKSNEDRHYNRVYPLEVTAMTLDG